MAIDKTKKAQILKTLEAEFQSAKSVTFTSYHGLNVADITDLRDKLREQDVKLIIAKKTLVKLAAKNTNKLELGAEATEGPIAIAFAHGDELAAAQTLYKFGKDNKAVNLLGGILDGELIDQAQIAQLASLPSRKDLLGQVVGLMASPMRGIASVGYNIISGLVRALTEIEKKKATET